MPYAVEPGTRLAGRYRLRAPVDPTDGAALVPPDGRSVHWLAVDELLNRTVGIRVLAADAPYAGAVLTAARRAAAVEDPLFLAILDANSVDGIAYVVSEWVPSRDLAEILGTGALPTPEAQWMSAEVARGLSVAHDAGLAHRRLIPEAVLRSESGRVRVAGLAVDAALHGLDPYVSAQAVSEDVHAAGAVLYATLTGRWPLSRPDAPTTRLAAAPIVDGTPCSPRQVRAAIPAELDDLACRALGAPRRRGGAPLASVGQLAHALTGSTGAAVDPVTGPLPAVESVDDGVGLLAAPDAPGRAGRAGMALVAGLVALSLTLLGWQVFSTRNEPGDPAPTRPPSPTVAVPADVSAIPPGTPIPVADVLDFDPQGDGEEHPELLDQAVDGDPETAWITSEYYNSPFGGLKSGLGLVLDLGQPRQVSTVTLGLLGRGSGVELRAASGPHPPEDLSGYDVVAATDEAGSLLTLRPESPVRARYLLVWFTALPVSGENSYRGGLTDVRVRA